MARVKTFTIRAGYTAAGLNDSPGDVLDNRQHVRGRVQMRLTRARPAFSVTRVQLAHSKFESHSDAY